MASLNRAKNKGHHCLPETSPVFKNSKALDANPVITIFTLQSTLHHMVILTCKKDIPAISSTRQDKMLMLLRVLTKQHKTQHLFKQTKINLC